ncbi:hypothetical protein [Corallococcus sp. Z5C101001]|uniref:hypothetical protein n=1 Tax=Corallococcus sp. Z5C101001 TaxID=2596829 RepID=UPI00117F0E57|nr:hypothetical protein [Corallococcus sp. Z5C101001]TSC34146.1 hypothetical protein FOF48_03660 [Corallococcus sp. Z5C101001]
MSDWRELGGQPFVSEDALRVFTREHGLETTPRILELDGADLPRNLDCAFGFPRTHAPASRCALDAGAGRHPEGLLDAGARRHPEGLLDAGAGRHPEGIGGRTCDWRTLVKPRDEDSERPLRVTR